jgi:hypothetical protein
LWSRAFNLPVENVFCLISSKVSSLGTYTGCGFSTRVSQFGSKSIHSRQCITNQNSIEKMSGSCLRRTLYLSWLEIYQFYSA